MIERKTLAQPAVCAGIGLHTGARVRMGLKPAPAGLGIVFERIDLDPATDRRVPALHEHVHSTDLGTVLTNSSGASVATVEHLMAALAGLGIDDLIVELDGPEIPAMDGSSKPFIDLLLRAGVKSHPAPRRFIQVLKRVEVEDAGRLAAFLPSVGPAIDVTIDFADAAIGRQQFRFDVNEDAFINQVAPARTFGFRREYESLLKAGLARGGSMSNAIVVDETGVANPEGLRFDDEFVRHKALDALGDIYLAGAPILGLYRAERPGHRLNALAVKALLADVSAWTMITLAADEAVQPRRARG